MYVTFNLVKVQISGLSYNANEKFDKCVQFWRVQKNLRQKLEKYGFNKIL